ncbi:MULTISPECIES: PTS sugar transporter subunit IIA [Terrabacteria group]|uniref:PTS sugar transporter subunit IIA n=1 Tax=Bacillati TaxID=1783272 RepID=UPI00193974A9|nr:MULTISPECIES: fructose PTS transporter subunit IIA [Terrabacteria group]MBW9212630.1 fructose PTS transporter subunit IIA [Trueperella sp. zg.1013]QRG86877.1 PTS sugar transporter subunit IIA [Bulleidia sp. zg-1006]
MNAILNKEAVILNMNIETKDDCFKFISEKAESLRLISDSESLYQSLWRRENEISTGFTDGIAIPHAKDACVLKPAILFIKNNRGIDWKSLDGQLIRIVISIIVPANSECNLHLILLSKLAKKLMDEDFRAQLTSENNQDAIYQELCASLE